MKRKNNCKEYKESKRIEYHEGEIVSVRRSSKDWQYFIFAPQPIEPRRLRYQKKTGGLLVHSLLSSDMSDNGSHD